MHRRVRGEREELQRKTKREVEGGQVTQHFSQLEMTKQKASESKTQLN